ncbi:MAG: hypothetical protein U0802_11285 [Candidatus Binatia bacterium]
MYWLFSAASTARRGIAGGLDVLAQPRPRCRRRRAGRRVVALSVRSGLRYLEAAIEP